MTHMIMSENMTPKLAKSFVKATSDIVMSIYNPEAEFKTKGQFSHVYIKVSKKDALRLIDNGNNPTMHGDNDSLSLMFSSEKRN